MAAEKEPDSKEEFSDEKLKKSTRKTKVIVIAALTVFLLLGAVVSVSLYLTINQSTPSQSNRLTDVNLNTGDTLTYQVDQDIEAETGNDKQRGTIRAVVGIMVLNKTSEEYWFLMQFNVSQVAGEVDIVDGNETIDFFLIRFHLDSGNSSHGSNVSFEIYGMNSTDDGKLRLVYGILQQLLPTVKRDLYEKLDGKTTGSNSLSPEQSPLLPQSVRMHREANTSDKGTVSIQNHFDGSDFVGMPSGVDMDMKYSDSALIKKSNGMVSESRVYFSEQLNLGGEIDGQSGGGVPTMKVTLMSRISLVETEYFGFADLETDDLFVKLVVRKATARISVNNTQSESSEQSNSGNASLKRSRRSVYYNVSNVNESLVAEIWDRIPPVCLFVNRTTFLLLNKTVLGVRVKLLASLTVNIDGVGIPQIEVELTLQIGVRLFTVYSRNFTIPPQLGTGFTVIVARRSTILVNLSDFGIRSLRTKLLLIFNVQFRVSLPADGNSLDPLKLKVKVINLIYLSAALHQFSVECRKKYFRAVNMQGTLVDVSLPVTLSFCNDTLCASLSVRLTALRLGGRIIIRRPRLVIRRVCPFRWVWIPLRRSGWRRGRRWVRRRRCRSLRRWVYVNTVHLLSVLYPTVNRNETLLQVCNMTKNESISISPSLSPSTSFSLSASISLSTSVSISPTTSASPPASLSTSALPSASLSISASPSTSIPTS
ncbi:unnamed protein product, partial [Porites lobata]